MTRFLILNGPPRCGKDTVQSLLRAQILSRPGEVSVRKIKLSDELKRRTHALYGVRDSAGDEVPVDFFESTKDSPCPQFLGRTPRQAYIDVSERLLKPVHGESVLGRLAVAPGGSFEGVEESDVAIVDAGFRAEIEPAIEKFGNQNFVLIRIYRQGSDFAGDSRSYFDLEDVGIPSVELHNPVPKGEFDPKGIDRLGDEIADSVETIFGMRRMALRA